jgi:hypothetical protein
MELEDYFQTEEFKNLRWCKKLFIRIKIAFIQMIKTF